MTDSEVLILRGDEVVSLLEGAEGEIIDTVAEAYRIHGRGESALPHSLFLRFPDAEENRIIALPAFLGDGFGVAGMKWIASFPGNLEKGMARASAVMVLNSADTGRPGAILEASVVSASRTAASAALAARVLTPEPPRRAGLVGTGLINAQVARFLLHALPGIERFDLFDLDAGRAAAAAARLEDGLGVDAAVATSAEDLFAACPLISFATTAVHPHVSDLSMCPPGTVVLHVSLRDVAPQVVLGCDNVVDDVDHVCRAGTSLHLAEELSGDRGFIRCTLADVLDGRAEARRDDRGTVIFSPFGLGVLDLAVGRLVTGRARQRQVGMAVADFLPTVPGWA